MGQTNTPRRARTHQKKMPDCAGTPSVASFFVFRKFLLSFELRDGSNKWFSSWVNDDENAVF